MLKKCAMQWVFQLPCVLTRITTILCDIKVELSYTVEFYGFDDC